MADLDLKLDGIANGIIRENGELTPDKVMPFLNRKRCIVDHCLYSIYGKLSVIVLSTNRVSHVK